MKILDEFIQEVKKFGQRRASELSGVALKTITNWCQGITTPTLVKAQKVANAMGLEFLLFDKE